MVVDHEYIIPHQVKLFYEDKICIFIRFDRDEQEQCVSLFERE